MRRPHLPWVLLPLFVIVCILMVFIVLPPIGASAVLRPTRRAMNAPTPAGCDDVRFSGEGGVMLTGWRCTASGAARGAAVVAAEPFSDLRTVAIERAPWVFTAPSIARAFALIARDGGFSVDDVSPRLAASQIRAPVLLIHGAADTETPPDHSQRILAQLAGPKRLILVPNAHHSGALRPDVWPEIDRWFDVALAGWTPPN